MTFNSRVTTTFAWVEQEFKSSQNSDLAFDDHLRSESSILPYIITLVGRTRHFTYYRCEVIQGNLSHISGQCSHLTTSAPTPQMVKHTQTIHRLLPTNCLSVFDHFVGLALKGSILPWQDHENFPNGIKR